MQTKKIWIVRILIYAILLGVLVAMYFIKQHFGWEGIAFPKP